MEIQATEQKNLSPPHPSGDAFQSHSGIYALDKRRLASLLRGLESLFFWWVGGWRAFSVLWENLPEKPCNHQKFACGGLMVELQTQGAEKSDSYYKIMSNSSFTRSSLE